MFLFSCLLQGEYGDRAVGDGLGVLPDPDGRNADDSRESLLNDDGRLDEFR